MGHGWRNVCGVIPGRTDFTWAVLQSGSLRWCSEAIAGRGSSPWSLEFQILGTNTTSFNELTGPSSYRAYRVVHWGEDGYKYFEELHPFERYRDGFFGYVTTTSFCRDSKSIHVRIQNRRTP